jgi:hypothetical protein
MVSVTGESAAPAVESHSQRDAEPYSEAEGFCLLPHSLILSTSSWVRRSGTDWRQPLRQRVKIAGAILSRKKIVSASRASSIRLSCMTEVKASDLLGEDGQARLHACTPWTTQSFRTSMTSSIVAPAARDAFNGLR